MKTRNVILISIAITLTCIMMVYAFPNWKEYPIDNVRIVEMANDSSVDAFDPLVVAHAYTIPANHQFPEDCPTLKELIVSTNKINELHYVYVLHYPGGNKGGDSIHEWKDKVEVKKYADGWKPIAHGRMWKGRGRLGWTTNPCL